MLNGEVRLFCILGSARSRICINGFVYFFFAKMGQVVREEDDIGGEVVLPLTGFFIFFFKNEVVLYYNDFGFKRSEVVVMHNDFTFPKFFSLFFLFLFYYFFS